MPFSLIWTDTFKLTDSEIYLLDVGTHDESYGVMVIILVAVAVPPPIVAVALIVTGNKLFVRRISRLSLPLGVFASPWVANPRKGRISPRLIVLTVYGLVPFIVSFTI